MSINRAKKYNIKLIDLEEDQSFNRDNGNLGGGNQ